MYVELARTVYLLCMYNVLLWSTLHICMHMNMLRGEGVGAVGNLSSLESRLYISWHAAVQL
jgi:hypothetical protein